MRGCRSPSGCSAAITSHLGVFAIIGGFVIGVALHDDRAAAFVSKFGGADVVARPSARGALQRPHHRCLHEHAGPMELIVLHIGKDLGLLPTDVVSMLVIMALVSTHR